jgi:hypothetical protein
MRGPKIASIMHRRSALAHTLGVLLSTSLPTAPMMAEEDRSSAAALLAMIPSLPYGAPATNLTVPTEVVRAIEGQAALLEKRSGNKNLASAPSLSDSWRLVYSNGREISNLAVGLPLGFTLGKTFQPLDVATGRCETCCLEPLTESVVPLEVT